MTNTPADKKPADKKPAAKKPAAKKPAAKKPAAKKTTKKKTTKKPKRSSSGFAKPTIISKELCDFLQKSYGTEMARTEVTKHLTTYIKDHNLQDKSDKRKIIPDEKLKNLLKVQNDEQVTYFNLQKWLKPHFSKSSQIAPPSS